MNSRRLKVGYHCASSQELRGVLPPMPFLRLQGRWLDQAGFAIGVGVCVEVTPGRLVLEVMEAEPVVAAPIKHPRKSFAD
jgi:hypothetical protein